VLRWCSGGGSATGNGAAANSFGNNSSPDGYCVDFVCRDRRPIVEIDGGRHADNAADQKRDAKLAILGYRIIRFWNSEILKNIEGVLQRLLADVSDSPSP